MVVDSRLKEVVEHLYHEEKFSIVSVDFKLERKPLEEVYKTILNSGVLTGNALDYSKQDWEEVLQEDYLKVVRDSTKLRRLLFKGGVGELLDVYFTYTDRFLPQIAYFSTHPIAEWFGIVHRVLTTQLDGKGVNDPYFTALTDRLVDFVGIGGNRDYATHERYKKKVSTPMYKQVSKIGFVSFDTFLNAWDELVNINKKLNVYEVKSIVGDTYVIYLEMCLGVAVDKPLNKKMGEIAKRVAEEIAREKPKLGEPKLLFEKAMKERCLSDLDRCVYFGEKVVVVDWVTEKVLYYKNPYEVRVKDIKGFVKWLTGE